MRGKLIVIEGGDASGKATQTKLLLKRLKKEGHKTATMAFPQYYKSFYGKLTGRYLKGEFGQVDDVSPYLSCLLYACDRWSIRDKLLQWLNQGRTVVSDRYVSASKGYMAGKFKSKQKQDKFINWIDKLEYRTNQMPRPDLIIYLNVPSEISKKLVIKKGYRSYMKGTKHDIHEKNREYQERVEKIFKRLSKKAKWVYMNCFEDHTLLPKKQIADKIWQIVKKKL